MSQVSERREHTRYNAHHLKVLVKPYNGTSEEWEMAEISSVDFNRFGIGLETSCPFSVGEIVMLVIRTDDASISELPGIICNRVQSEEGFRFGIRFEYDQQEGGTTLSEQLLMMEQEAATLH